MINIEKNIKFKNKINKKVLIFDLDGVLVDSKINMKKAWAAVQKKFNFQEKKFRDYFSKIGQPFNIILSQLSILNNHKQIKKCYDSNSIKNLEIVKFYPKTIKELKWLYSKNFYLCIVTSKDKKGNPIGFSINMIINLAVFENEILKGKTNFEKSFEYNNKSNKFDLKQYEKNIKDNLIKKLSDEIIRYLNSLK